MFARLERRPLVLLAAFGFASTLVGLLVSLLDPKWAVAGIVGAAVVGYVLYDYRVGAICLTLLLPWISSPLLPRTHGFDVINLLILASGVSLILRRTLRREPTVPLPAVTRWCYLIPIAVGALVAWPYLPEGARNFPSPLAGEPSAFATEAFFKSRVIKPLYFVLYAFLMANAVRDSKRPERFLVVFGVSAVLAAIAIVVTAAQGGIGVTDRGNYLTGLGLHSNSYGMLLGLACGPLFALCLGGGRILTRAASIGAFIVVSGGLFLTGSRGGALVYLIAIAVILIRRHRFTDLLLVILAAGALSFAVPDRVWDRLTLGLDNFGAASINTRNDDLTKGRVASWALLAPEILESPIWGKGIGSTAWNAATNSRQYGATLAHNMYLDILLDIGILGFFAISYLYYRYAQALKRLSEESDLSPPLRDFFLGAFASFLGMLAMAFTNGWWMPHPEQTFMWFGLGLAFAYWQSTIRYPIHSSTVTMYQARNAVNRGRATVSKADQLRARRTR
jgi:O-antigen ligase